ncbi:DUF6461 domain-containing protein [Microtetraspora fusca]|uniref:DUF6461 domain-containing protein n=1 Tax=Microtetraspora fusca TaxID=1997 RepID=A0ABW6VJF3_MICFU
MSSRTRLYELLYSYVEQYDDAVNTFEEFAALWCEGRDPQEVAALLGADLTSVHEAALADVAEIPGLHYLDGVILAGRAGAWTLTIQKTGPYLVDDETLMRLSQGGRRALSVSWNIGGNEDLSYAVDGCLIVRFSFAFPDIEGRTGQDVTALDPLMEGLRFGLGEDDYSGEECISSAFTLAGRVTGQEIDAAWLDASHEQFVIPHTR